LASQKPPGRHPGLLPKIVRELPKMPDNLVGLKQELEARYREQDKFNRRLWLSVAGSTSPGTSTSSITSIVGSGGGGVGSVPPPVQYLLRSFLKPFLLMGG
jgi:hypothetical protein